MGGHDKQSVVPWTVDWAGVRVDCGRWTFWCGRWRLATAQKPVVFPHKVKGQPMNRLHSGGMESDPVLSSSSGVVSGVPCLFQVYILGLDALEHYVGV